MLRVPLSDTETRLTLETQTGGEATMMEMLLGLHNGLDAQLKDLEDLKASRGRAPEMATRPGTEPAQHRNRQSARYQADPTMAPPFTDATKLEELAKDIQVKVGRRMRQLALLSPYSTDTSYDDDEDHALVRWHRKPVKSGKLWMADIQVL